MDLSGNDQLSGLRPVNRPELLKYLCILSFVGSGLAAVSNLFIFLSYDEMVNLTDEINLDLPEFEMMMSGGKKFFFTGFILYSLSLFGAIKNVEAQKNRISSLYNSPDIYYCLAGGINSCLPLFVFEYSGYGSFILGYAVHLKIHGLENILMEENDPDSGKQAAIFFIHPVYGCFCLFRCFYSYFFICCCFQQLGLVCTN